MNETELRSTPVVANCAWCRSAFPALIKMVTETTLAEAQRLAAEARTR